MTNWDNLAGAAVGLLGIAVAVDVAKKVIDKVPKPKVKKGEKIEW